MSSLTFRFPSGSFFEPGLGQPLPLGPYREPFGGSKRTKTKETNCRKMCGAYGNRNAEGQPRICISNAFDFQKPKEVNSGLKKDPNCPGYLWDSRIRVLPTFVLVSTFYKCGGLHCGALQVDPCRAATQQGPIKVGLMSSFCSWDGRNFGEQPR